MRFVKYMMALATIVASVGTMDAQATVIDFENIDTTNAPYGALITDGDYVTQDGYFFKGIELNGVTGTIVGSLIDGADPATCPNGNCPADDATNYMAGLNDGIIGFGKIDQGLTSLLSFDAAFLAAPEANPIDVPSLLTIQSVFADGSFSESYYRLGGIGLSGATAFQTYQVVNPVAAVNFFAFAYRCDATGNCKAFSSNEGQFAFDNLRFADAVTGAVPEPATWAMMLLGFGITGSAMRRRKIIAMKASFA